MPTAAAWHARICACPQAVAFYSDADIIGLGGGAGGGKTSWEIGTSFTQHRRSIIFRREKTQARDFLAEAERLLRIAQEPFEVNHQLMTLVIPRHDVQLEFGGIQNMDDWRKHGGRPKDGIFFDEATEFEEDMIRSLIAWNRSAIPGQRSQMGLCFNPPTIRHGMWLRTFFGPWLDRKHPKYPAPYGQKFWYTTIDDVDVEMPGPEPVEVTLRSGRKEVVRPISRTFIRALVDDNEYYRDTDYKAKLMSLPGPMRGRMLYGDFDVEEADEPNQCIPTRWVLEANDRWLALQEASTTTDGRPDAPLSAIGADPARGGTNKTAFVARIGTWFDYPEAHPGVETLDGAEVIERLAKFKTQYRVVRDVVVGMDVIGVGTSPVDEGRRQGMSIVAMDGGGSPPDNAKDRSGLLSFKNLRAYWYWSLREALDPIHGQNLALPPDPELTGDLCGPTYDDKLLCIQIEKKKDVAKRLGRSPDKGDAFVYAFAVRPFIIGYQTVTERRKGFGATGQVRRRGKW